MLTRGSIPIYAIDCPSGLNCTTGETYGPCIKASATSTLAALKIGFKNPKSKFYLGDLYLADIGVPPHIYNNISAKNMPKFNNLVTKVYQ